MPEAVTIELKLGRRWWGWHVMQGHKIRRMNVLPRRTEQSARKAAERAARAVLQDNRKHEITYPFVDKEM